MGLLKLQYKQKNAFSLITGMLKMASATFSSRILGLVREQTIAHYFGASGLTDAFLVAYRIPNLLRDMFAEGAFSSAFVPNFISAKIESLKSARELLWSMTVLLSIITAFIGLLIYLFSPELIHLFAPEFTPGTQKYLAAIELTRILSPFLFFISIAAIFMGALNAFKVFFIPSMAPAVFNAATIVMLLFMMPKTIYLLGYAAMVGALMQVLVQLPSLWKIGLAPIKLSLSTFTTSHVKKIFRQLGPGIIGLAATQINLLISTILATSYEGAVSWLNYAFRLFQFPIGILGVSLASSNLVHFAQHWKANEQKEATDLLGLGLSTSFELMAPCALFLFLYAHPIIALVFESGVFSSQDTIHVAQLLQFYALGLVFYGPYKILTPTFYTMGAEKIPVYCALAGIACNIVFCLLLTPHFGHSMLALGAGVSIFVNTMLLAIILKKKLKLSNNFFINQNHLQACVSLVVSYSSVRLFNIHTTGPLSVLVVKGSCLFIFYFAILFLFKKIRK